MVKAALFVRLEAKPGKAVDVENFLRGGIDHEHGAALQAGREHRGLGAQFTHGARQVGVRRVIVKRNGFAKLNQLHKDGVNLAHPVLPGEAQNVAERWLKSLPASRRKRCRGTLVRRWLQTVLSRILRTACAGRTGNYGQLFPPREFNDYSPCYNAT